MELFRPVGLAEMRLILATDSRAFPPRLPEQPIFYPVLNLEYARQISRQWNARSSPYAGYVTRFTIDDKYGEGFEPHIVGSRIHEEFWVPAEELTTFNDHIQPPIHMVEAYFGPLFRGDIPQDGSWAGCDARAQLALLDAMASQTSNILAQGIEEHILSISLNLPFWQALHDAGKLSAEEQGALQQLSAIHDVRLPWHVVGYLEEDR